MREDRFGIWLGAPRFSSQPWGAYRSRGPTRRRVRCHFAWGPIQSGTSRAGFVKSKGSKSDVCTEFHGDSPDKQTECHFFTD